MHQVFIEGGLIRKLWTVETTVYRDHLLRLDPESRRNRFNATISDDTVRGYAATARVRRRKRQKRHARGKVHARSASDPKTTAHARHLPATCFTATIIVLLINVLIVLRGYWDDGKLLRKPARKADGRAKPHLTTRHNQRRTDIRG